ncbi:hypothetical protein [Micromonospora sp. NPDC050200]|uniref:hypothetical protein n=1 Tax=Micromonospora sp. NPDC050200 TaxID=3155664 RepID=UPI0033FAADDF
MTATRTTVLVATVVTAMSALVGCGGGDAAPQSAASAVTASSSAAAATPAAPSYKILDRAALAKALLTLKEMPAGYSEDPSKDEDGPDKTFCNYRQPYTAKIKVSAAYQKGGGLKTEIASIALRQYANADQAKASFAKMAETLETCKKDSSEGQKLTYALMNLPKMGDDSLGVRIETQSATVLQGFAVVGPTLISTGAGGLMSADADVVADLLDKQVDRYAAAAAR